MSNSCNLGTLERIFDPFRPESGPRHIGPGRSGKIPRLPTGPGIDPLETTTLPPTVHHLVTLTLDVSILQMTSHLPLAGYEKYQGLVCTTGLDE